MAEPISLNSITNKFSPVAPWAMHAFFASGVGFYTGQAINLGDRWLHPVKNALGKPPLVNPYHGAICGVAFSIIDHFAHLAQNYFKSIAHKPLTNGIRIFISVTITSLLASAILPISTTMAAVLLTTNIVASTILINITNTYTSLHYGNGTPMLLVDKKPDAVNKEKSVGSEYPPNLKAKPV